ncbi:MAG: hypothetical protein K2M06_01715 [Muribaculaceae bacterium]|nr:hypothetical protein [Muribaculaceae bacterium]
MLSYLKYLLQLLLVPSSGWDDIAQSSPDPAMLLRRGFYPLLAVVALSEFCGLLYNKGLSVDTVILRAIVDLGTYFVSYYLARIAFEMYIRPLSIASAADSSDRSDAIASRSLSLILFALGEMLIFRFIANILQADITIIKFLPLYLILILYKARGFMNIRNDSVMNFTCLAAVATILIPLILHYILSAILL